jgi:hypothetical protein
LIEDQLINDFIKEEVPILFSSSSLRSRYSHAKEKEKSLYDALSLQVFDLAYKDFVAEHPDRGTSLEFVNFIKLHDPSREYLTKLRNEIVPENDPAAIWESVYEQDIGLMRISALKGFKSHVAEPMEEKKTIDDLG